MERIYMSRIGKYRKKFDNWHNLTISVKIKNSSFALTGDFSSSNPAKRNSHTYAQMCMYVCTRLFTRVLDVAPKNWYIIYSICWYCHDEVLQTRWFISSQFWKLKSKIQVLVGLVFPEASLLVDGHLLSVSFIWPFFLCVSVSYSLLGTSVILV